ncbi:hypothetical protein M5K25_004927 [Dendrobium thyrsiflorum]|uniref:Uncharacterized protein n=1 Tax=Dendrobium thyrsiflorum TaxID=117978 RepID=A0ABD0VNH2_DENTH
MDTGVQYNAFLYHIVSLLPCIECTACDGYYARLGRLTHDLPLPLFSREPSPAAEFTKELPRLPSPLPWQLAELPSPVPRAFAHSPEPSAPRLSDSLSAFARNLPDAKPLPQQPPTPGPPKHSDVASPSPTPKPLLRPVLAKFSPVHKAVLARDYSGLKRILAGLPRLLDPLEIKMEAASLAEEEKADAVSAVIDKRDVPNRETPLHLAVRLGDATVTEMLMVAGADWSLQNEQGWSSLQEAICAREENLAKIIIRHYQPLAWAKWCRRLPRVVSTMRRMRDFYMEITFHFESSVIPFISRIAPSDSHPARDEPPVSSLPVRKAEQLPSQSLNLLTHTQRPEGIVICINEVTYP